MIENHVLMETDRCKGCGLCTVACPEGLLIIEEAKLNVKGYHPAVIKRVEECIGCGNCAQMCPDYVITIDQIVH